MARANDDRINTVEQRVAKDGQIRPPRKNRLQFASTSLVPHLFNSRFVFYRLSNAIVSLDDERTKENDDVGTRL